MAEKNLKRLWSKIDIKGLDECWLWKARETSGNGYGRIYWEGKRRQSVSRIIYKLHCGELDDSEEVRHTCNNPPCCNPAHFLKGTHKDNMADRVASGRQYHPRGEKNGRAKLTQENVAYVKKQLELGRTQTSLAKELGVSCSVIHHIAHGRLWRCELGGVS